MSGFLPVEIAFTPSNEALDEIYRKIADLLTRKYRFRKSKERGLCTFAVDYNSSEPYGLSQIAEDRILHKVSPIANVVVSGQGTIGGVISSMDLFVWRNSDNSSGVTLKLGSHPYEAIFGFADRANGKFDEDAKAAILEIILENCAALKPAGFALRRDIGALESLSMDDMIERVLKPEMTIRGRRPYYIMGFFHSHMKQEDIEAVWGEGPWVYGASAGYTIFDGLLPPGAYD